MEIEVSDLREIEIGTANELCKILKEIENSWSKAYNKLECKSEEERNFMTSQAQELMIKFLKKAELFNEWNEFNVQKIGWPDFDVFEVKNNSNSQVLLRLGPGVEEEGLEWNDAELRIKVLRYLRHLEVIELKKNIKEKYEYKKAFNAAMTRLQSMIWNDDSEE